MKLFSLHDLKARTFARPFAEESTASAMRSFSVLANDPKAGLVNQFPDDYALFEIGTFDKETGILQSYITNLGSARTVLRQSGDLQ